ncbi:MAG: rod shape-determining protein, partial [Oscillospiraceae bacterium]|nr:rod shape-determining protein [Oscillospiraceae bacterium]
QDDAKKALSVAVYNHYKRINNIENILEETPPELVGDIYASGILLTGGGSLINQLPELITEKIGVTARLADDPKECVVNGVGKSLDLLDNFSSIFLNATA